MLITYIMTTLAIVGTVANSFKKRWCFILWGVTNCFWCGYWIFSGEYAAAIQYGFNLIMAVVGFIKWGEKPQKGA